MSLWMLITRFGDTNVTMPVAAGIFVWLIAARARYEATCWAALFGGALVLVAITKIAFIGWGIGSRELDFTGISGHAMRAAAVLPVVLTCFSWSARLRYERQAQQPALCLAV